MVASLEIEHSILLLVHEIVVIKALKVLVVAHLSGWIHKWWVHKKHLLSHVVATLHTAHLTHLGNEIGLVDATEIHHVSELVVVFSHVYVVAHIDIVYWRIGVVHHVHVVVRHPLLRIRFMHIMHSKRRVMASVHTSHAVHWQQRIGVHHAVCWAWVVRLAHVHLSLNVMARVIMSLRLSVVVSKLL